MLYKRRIVFFADILGFKSTISSSYNIAEVEEVTSRIASALKRIPEFSNDTASCQSENIDFQFTQFSDCFIISFACEETSQLFYTLLRILWVQMNLISLGFLLRGAVTVGPAVHTKDYVFGPAIVEAAMLEKDKAIFPRIILEDEAIKVGALNGAHAYEDEVSYIKKILAIDPRDSRYYIDYFAAAITEMDSEYDYPVYLVNIKKIIQKGLQNHDAKYIEKYIWMKEKYNEVANRKQLNMHNYEQISQDSLLVSCYKNVTAI